MQLDLILSSLRHHRAFAFVIVAQVAICVAILANAAFFVQGRVERIGMPSGLDEETIARLRPVNLGETENPDALTQSDLQAIRAIPEVISASHSSMVPMSESDDALALRLDPDAKEALLHATVYYGDHQLLDTMGLELVAGRKFGPEDEVPWPKSLSAAPHFPSAIITSGLAASLFPNRNPLGQIFYADDGRPIRVVGVVRWLKRGYVLGQPSTFDHSLMLPTNAGYARFYGHYLIRTRPDQRDRVLEQAVKELSRIERKRVLYSRDTFEDIRKQYFRKDRALAIALTGICVALLTVASFGIVGISSFWVQRRTRQIGIRRAIGSTRIGVLGYFHSENLLLVGVGATLGVGGAYALNALLMHHYEFARLPLGYTLASMAATLVLGQLAVLQPSVSATRVPPSVALRMH